MLQTEELSQPTHFELSEQDKDALRMVFLKHPKTSFDDTERVKEILKRAEEAGVSNPTVESLAITHLIAK
jgi:hypothetical protein